MKKNLSAVLIMLSFPILLAGGNLKNMILSTVGILLLVLNACIILIPKRKTRDSQK